MNWPLTPFPIWLHELIYVVRWDIPRITKTQSGNFQFVFKNLNLCPKVYSLQSQEMHQTFETNNPNSLHEVWFIKSLCFPVKTQVTWGMPEPKYFKVLSGQNDPNFRFNLRFKQTNQGSLLESGEDVVCVVWFRRIRNHLGCSEWCHHLVFNEG
jgi:hypothetical protein